MSIEPVTAVYPATDRVLAEPDRPFGEPDRVGPQPNRVFLEPDGAYVEPELVRAAPGEAVIEPGYGVLEPGYGVVESVDGRPRTVAVPVTHAMELRLQEVAARSRAARAPLGGPERRPRRRLGRARRRAEAPVVQAEVEGVA
ncbi:MAG: hypothetical protein QOF77_1230 [Solirubrobacteraceae bacterium]|jgi:hypothetical protein|nr:hypothetical protein [Solirubrobacteraceae bacterium]